MFLSFPKRYWISIYWFKIWFGHVYGDQICFWEGLKQIDNNLDVTNRLRLSDNVNFDNSKYKIIETLLNMISIMLHINNKEFDIVKKN